MHAFFRLFPHLSQSSQATLLNLRQRPAAAQESDNAHSTSGRQSLEKVPACVVEEEDALHRNDRSVEQGMRDRSCTKSLAEMADIGTQCRPETKQDGKHGSDRCSENDCYNLGR